MHKELHGVFSASQFEERILLKGLERIHKIEGIINVVP